MKQITITPKTDVEYNLVIELLDRMSLNYTLDDMPNNQFSPEFLVKLKTLFETELGRDNYQKVNRKKLYGGFMSSMQALFDEKEV